MDTNVWDAVQGATVGDLSYLLMLVSISGILAAVIGTAAVLGFCKWMDL